MLEHFDTFDIQEIGFIEKWALSHGFSYVIGVDEAGRGCLAGPVAASAVCLPPDFRSDGLNDSKKLSPKNRISIAERVREHAVFALRFRDNDYIDRHGILKATFDAMRDAVTVVFRGLKAPVNQILVVVDGKLEIPNLQMVQKPWVKADSLSFAVAAASNIAKTNRDSYMEWAEQLYPGYGFAKHKGYGTAMHMEAIRARGQCPLHRHSFRMPAKSS